MEPYDPSQSQTKPSHQNRRQHNGRIVLSDTSHGSRTLVNGKGRGRGSSRRQSGRLAGRGSRASGFAAIFAGTGSGSSRSSAVSVGCDLSGVQSATLGVGLALLLAFQVVGVSGDALTIVGLADKVGDGLLVGIDVGIGAVLALAFEVQGVLERRLVGGSSYREKEGKTYGITMVDDSNTTTDLGTRVSLGDTPRIWIIVSVHFWLK